MLLEPAVVAPTHLHSTQQPQTVYKRKHLFSPLPPAPPARPGSAVTASQGPFQVLLFSVAPPQPARPGSSIPDKPTAAATLGAEGLKKNTRRPSEEEGGGSEGSRGGGCPGEHAGPRPAAPSPVGIARFGAVGTRSPGAPCRGAGGGSQSFPPWVPKVDAAVPWSWAPPPIGKGCPRFAWPRAPRSLGRGRPVLPGSPRTQHPAAAATCRESPRSPAPLGVRCCSRSSAATRTSPKRRGAPGTRSPGAAPSLPTPSRCPPPSGPGPAPPAEG